MSKQYLLLNIYNILGTQTFKSMYVMSKKMKHYHMKLPTHMII